LGKAWEERQWQPCEKVGGTIPPTRGEYLLHSQKSPNIFRGGTRSISADDLSGLEGSILLAAESGGSLVYVVTGWNNATNDVNFVTLINADGSGSKIPPDFLF
jgi:hypothetical protein